MAGLKISEAIGMVTKKELVLMAHIRKNSRVRLTQISKQTGIPVSTLFDMLKSTPLVAKFSALLDFPQLGFNTKAMLLLKAGKDSKDVLKAHLMKHQGINSMYRVNNGYDFLVEVVFRNMVELEEFIEKLENEYGIKTKEVHYLLEDLRREDFLADPQLVGFTADDL